METKPRATKKLAASVVSDQPADQTVSQQLRAAMADWSAYALCRASGVDVAAILRFKGGERTLTLKSVDKLCKAMGLEFRPVTAAPAPKK